MADRDLYILLEGNDDERFFRGIVLPRLVQNGRSARIWKYAREKHRRTEYFIRAIRSSGADFVLVRDIDTAGTISAKKQEVRSWFRRAIPRSNIAIVVIEIESWYLAGIPGTALTGFGITEVLQSTDGVTKEDFNLMVPPWLSHIQFMQEIIPLFDIGLARRRNHSFDYFMRRWVDEEMVRH
jgi:hypothetical protein